VTGGAAIGGAATPAGPGLRRELGLLDSLMINIGTILGSAIFIVPAAILLQTGTPFMSAMVWALAGFLSWAGAATIAELAVLYPEAGGQYVYLEKVYSRFWGFLYGWTLFAVIQTASIAAVAVAFVTYVGFFIPMSPVMVKVGAIALIMGLSIWNCLSVRTSANTQNSTTILKLLMVGLIAAACFAYGGEGSAAFKQLLPADGSTLTLAGFAAAMVAALWAYDGWISITFVGGEVKSPAGSMPKALSRSVSILVIVYILVNFAYVHALPYADMVASERVAADAVERVLGHAGGGLASLAVAISCFGTVNGFIFTGARVYYAMAKDGVFFPWAARLGEKTKVPANSLIIQGVWASLLTLTGSYDQLFTYVIFDSWLFYAMGALGVIILRRRQPDLPRPCKAPGYPWVPLIFVILAGALLLQTLISDTRDALFGVGIMLAGLPAYAYWTRAGRAKSAA